MQAVPSLPLDFASVVITVGRLVRRRSFLLLVGRWARLSYRVLFWGYRLHYLWRYSIRSHDPRIFQLLGKVLAGLIVPSDWQDLIDITLEIRSVLADNLPDFAATRIISFLGRGGGARGRLS